MADPDYGAVRTKTFQDALTKPNPQEDSLLPDSIINSPIQPDLSVSDVVFVVHGIRDQGFWTEKIARRVMARAAREAKSRKFAYVTASYGYFPMLSFLRPGARQEKVEWLMDQYAQAKARYPRAQFSYIGHSHGTYLLIKALQDYSAVKFRNVLFAGSVVRTDQAWPPDGVTNAFNVRASSDWVVAWFPHLLEQLHLQDVGGGGFFGFQQATPDTQLDQYADGSHSAALHETWWDCIAGFVIDGRFESPPENRVRSEPAWLVNAGACAPYAVWVLILAVALALLWLLLHFAPREWQKTLVVVGFIWFVWSVLTKA
jgi:hypothetical protein